MSLAAKKPVLYFFLFWAITFVLYLPAASAGFVQDFTGWLDQVRNHSFLEFVNQTNYHVQSLYQFTQFNTYVFYQLFGAHQWPWHLLFVTLQAVNSYLLFRLLAALFVQANVQRGNAIAVAGVCLFCVSPCMSEIIVWEPSYHYLQGLLLILLVLRSVQRYALSRKPHYIWLAAILYFLSAFSLEIFYITPWLVLTLALFYRYITVDGKPICKKIILLFFLPQLFLFAVHLLTYHVVYGNWIAHIGSSPITNAPFAYLGKPAKYLFHIIFLGRFFPDAVRQHIYSLCDAPAGIIAFFGIAIAIFISIIARFRQMTGKGKTVVLLYTWTCITLLILLPLWFPDSMLVVFDRYTYFTAAFLYPLLALLISYISSRYLAAALVFLYALLNIRFTFKLNRFWGKSAKVISGLLHTVPDPGDRTVILLNLPESMKGAEMIGAERESEFRLMHNLLIPDHMFRGPFFDALSYNMLTPGDGAHVNVLNDSTIRVTLSQWGTWWWYEGKGAYSYENSAYKLNLVDGGHFYELTLKKAPQQYLLLYQAGPQWKTADWSKKNQEQY